MKNAITYTVAALAILAMVILLDVGPGVGGWLLILLILGMLSLANRRGYI